MTMSPALAAADAYCWHLACQHYENFTVASRLLPSGLRRHLARVYAYCRTTDDLGDERGEGARGALERWRADVQELFAGGQPLHPVLYALRETVAAHGLPAQPFLDLIQANLQDQEVSSYRTWPELRAYCALSAAPVGRLVLRLFGLTAPEAERLSDDVCIGLQLANFAQDVSVDARKGRSYLLEPELASGGVAGAVRAHCERARALLGSGRELEALAPWPLRLQLALYRLGGTAILDAIERAGYRTDRHRPRVGGAARALVLARAVADSLARGHHGRGLEAA